jgi:hypothetical protein
MAEVSCHSGCVYNIIEVQFCHGRVQLQQHGKWLTNALKGMQETLVCLNLSKYSDKLLPPLAPMTATALLWALLVENCLVAMANGCWNLENILI